MQVLDRRKNVSNGISRHATVLLDLCKGCDRGRASGTRPHLLLFTPTEERDELLLHLWRDLSGRRKAGGNLGLGLSDFLEPHFSERVGKLSHCLPTAFQHRVIV